MTAACKSEIGNLRLRYEITETEVGNGTMYGISITSENENGYKESDAVQSITTNRNELEALCRKMCDGFVTPVTLRDIVADYLNR